ncbi:MAG: hypothetical protein RLZZ344_814 [Pseudomonadota bacterium]|jgi:hypothetical protein
MKPARHLIPTAQLSLGLVLGLGLGLPPAEAAYLILERNRYKVAYVDLMTVQTTEKGRKFLVIHDFLNPDLLGHMSRRHVHEIDCQGKKARTMAYALFTGKRGTGRSSLGEAGGQTSPWKPIRGKNDPMEVARARLCPA